MKNILFLIILYLLTQNSFSQIGVNTNNPKALLHIDGASAAVTTNPESGNVSALQASDDVVITSDGNIGIGKLDPAAKVDVISPTSGAIRISDTTEGVGKVLVSDANGTGSWVSVPGSWYAILSGGGSGAFNNSFNQRQINSYTTSVISSPVDGAVSTTNGTITVPFAGKYRITISGHWGTNRLQAAGTYRIIPMCFVNGVSRWEGLAIGYTPWAGMSWGLSSVFIFNTSLNAGDIVSVFMDERFNNASNTLTRCMLSIEFMD